jgi:hypothetical protein
LARATSTAGTTRWELGSFTVRDTPPDITKNRRRNIYNSIIKNRCTPFQQKSIIILNNSNNNNKCITTTAGFNAAVEGIKVLQSGDLGVRPIQEWLKDA